MNWKPAIIVLEEKKRQRRFERTLRWMTEPLAKQIQAEVWEAIRKVFSTE